MSLQCFLSTDTFPLMSVSSGLHVIRASKPSLDAVLSLHETQDTLIGFKG